LKALSCIALTNYFSCGEGYSRLKKAKLVAVVERSIFIKKLQAGFCLSVVVKVKENFLLNLSY